MKLKDVHETDHLTTSRDHHVAIMFDVAHARDAIELNRRDFSFH